VSPAVTDGARGRLVGVIHLPPLPGSPGSSLSCADVARAAAKDARALADAGFDLAMIENFGDAPFFAGEVPPVTVSAMTACAVAAREASPGIAIGINVLRNDARAALAIAAVVGAACIRVNVHAGARVTDQGLVEGRAAETLRLRRALGAESVAIWADVNVKHSAPLAPRDVGLEAEDLVKRALADAVLVTGWGTGKGVDEAELQRVRESVRGGGGGAGPLVLVASGATVESLAKLAPLCDGIIVGSALRADGVAGGAVDPRRAEAFAAAFRRAF
jgi:membrane complex biogenesis BtpA family protein